MISGLLFSWKLITLCWSCCLILKVSSYSKLFLLNDNETNFTFGLQIFTLPVHFHYPIPSLYFLPNWPSFILLLPDFKNCHYFASKRVMGANFISSFSCLSRLTKDIIYILQDCVLFSVAAMAASWLIHHRCCCHYNSPWQVFHTANSTFKIIFQMRRQWSFVLFCKFEISEWTPLTNTHLQTSCTFLYLAK